MKKMKFTIAVKTTMAAAIVVLMLLGTLIYMLLGLSAYRGIFRAEVDSFGTLQILDDSRRTWTNMRSEETWILEKFQSGAIESFDGEAQRVQKVEESQQKLNENLKKLSAMNLTPEQQKLTAALQDAVKQYSQQWQTLRTGVTNPDKAAALAASEAFTQWQEEHVYIFSENAQAFIDTLASARTESENARSTVRNTTMVISGVILVAAVVVLFLVVRALVKPLTRSALALSEGMDKLASGDFTAQVVRESTDELGDMSESFNDALVRLRNSVGATVSSANEVVGIAQGIGEVSSNVVTHASSAADYINTGATSAEQVSRSIQTVAAGAEEMSASIREISSNANAAASVAKEASEVASHTNETVAKLGESSKEIGEVIETITAVAQQTNLLALNATIEAARAGEAGRGFAVVASEVKDLAAETGYATEEVAVKVEQIQTDTEAAVAAIEEISNIIASINDYQTTIAAAVEEQTATTNEMSRSVAEAADSSTTIAENVADIARQTSELAHQFEVVNQHMGDLSSQSQELVSRMNRMKY